MSHALQPKDHNAPPITPPTPVELEGDLKARYPQLAERLAELQASAAGVPEKIEDEDTAGKVQALIRSMTVAKAQWKAARGVEKEPWSTLADVAFAFFKKAEDIVTPTLDALKAKLTVFLEAKAEAERFAREEKLKAQRAEAERLAAESAAAEARRLAAEKAEREARQREETARAEAAAAEKRKEEAEARAAAARAEEKRLAEEKAARLAVEKKDRVADLQEMTSLVLKAEQLIEIELIAQADADAVKTLHGLIGSGCDIAILNDRIARSAATLDASVLSRREALWARVTLLRAKLAGILLDKENADRAERRRIEDAERAERLRAESEQRVREQAIAQEAEEAARARRQKAEEDAAAASAASKAAKSDVKGALAQQRTARADQKEAAGEERETFRAAEKSDARANRMERGLQGASDADLSRTRGEHGTVGSLASRWSCTVIDRTAIPLDRISQYFDDSVLQAAAFRYMREHQGRWGDREIVDDELPGVVFERIPDARVV